MGCSSKAEQGPVKSKVEISKFSFPAMDNELVGWANFDKPKTEEDESYKLMMDTTTSLFSKNPFRTLTIHTNYAGMLMFEQALREAILNAK